MVRLLLALLLWAVASADDLTAELWVPAADRGALQRAIAAAANAPATTTTTIHLGAGRHMLARPLILDRRHSGTRFVGHGVASISGGVSIEGWELAGAAHCAGCSEVWRARTPLGHDSRQLYLPSSNERANRTWMPLPGGGPGEDSQGRVAVVGNPGAMASWQHNLSAIDMVYRGVPSAGVQWIEARCPCAGIVHNASSASLVIQVASLCWKSSHSWRDPGAHAGPAFVENVFELLGDSQFGHAGEFYLDAPAGQVFYVPHPRELQAGRAAFVAVLPVMEALLQVKGAQDLSFTGLTFEHVS